MENLIGRKVRGFKFETDLEIDLYYDLGMDNYIGKIGEITNKNDYGYKVVFDVGYSTYPSDQIKKHLVDEVPTHYDNTNGSLCLFAEQQGLNSWEFEVIKRIVRCRKKGEWESDVKKTIDSLNLYKEEQGHLYKGHIEPKNK